MYIYIELISTTWSGHSLNISKWTHDSNDCGSLFLI